MKRTVLLLTALFGCAMVAQSQETANDTSKLQAPVVQQQSAPVQEQSVAPADTAKWDFFQLGFWFGVPSQTETSDVCGMKLGVPSCGGSGHVYGLETSVCASGTDYVKGVQCSLLVDVSKKVTGVQGAVINYCETVKGLQLGVLNFAKDGAFQFGLLNHIESSPVPYLPICNVYFK